MALKKSLLISAGVLSFIVTAVATVPAAIVLPRLPLPANVQLGPASGTLWQGQVQAIQQGSLVLSDVRWQWQPSALLRGKLGVNITAGNIRQSEQFYVATSAEFGWQSLRLQHTDIRLPVARLLPMITLPMPVDASGVLRLDIVDYQWGQPYCQQLAGNTRWLQAKFKTPIGWLDLQQLQGVLRCDNGSLVLTTDGQNPLGLAVTAKLDAGAYSLSGTLKPDASMPREVHDAMQFVGQANADGAFPIQLAGQIRQQ
jgi:general secretion pathway protein N